MEQFERINHYEISIQKKYVVVKNIEKSTYFRLNETAKKYFLEHYKEDCFLEQLEKKIALQQIDRKNNRIIFKRRCSNKWNPYICRIPAIFMNILFMFCCIFMMLVIGLICIKTRPIGKIDGNKAIYFAFLLLNVFVHEMGHVFLCVYSGREVKDFGLKINFGIPMFFIDTSDICMASRIEKIKTSLGGIYFNAVLGILLFVIYVINKNFDFLYGSTISYFLILSNLVPFMKLDGYYIISDLLEIGNLNVISKREWNCFKKHQWKRNKLGLFLIAYYLIQNIFISGILCGIVYTFFKEVIT